MWKVQEIIVLAKQKSELLLSANFSSIIHCVPEIQVCGSSSGRECEREKARANDREKEKERKREEGVVIETSLIC